MSIRKGKTTECDPLGFFFFFFLNHNITFSLKRENKLISASDSVAHSDVHWRTHSTALYSCTNFSCTYNLSVLAYGWFKKNIFKK